MVGRKEERINLRNKVVGRRRRRRRRRRELGRLVMRVQVKLVVPLSHFV